MYFYIISGYETETSYAIEIVSDIDGGTTEIYTPVSSQIPIRQVLNYAQMHDAYDDGDTCYIGVDDTEEELYYEDGEEITPEILEQLEVDYEEHEEEPVGRIDSATGISIEFTTYTYSISSVSANASLTDSVTPTKEGYELVGAVGFSVVSTSGLIPFRVFVDEGVLNIGLRNVTSNAITDRTMRITLMWQRVIESEEDEDLDGSDNDNDSEEVVG